MEFGSVIKDEIERLRHDSREAAGSFPFPGCLQRRKGAGHLASADGIKRDIVIVTDSNTDAESWYCDLLFFRGNDRSSTVLLPSFETDPYSGASPHAETQERPRSACGSTSITA